MSIGCRTRCCRNCFQKKVHKTDEFFGNKSADAVLNSANDKIEKREPLEQIIIPLQERDKILNKSRQVLS